MMEPNHRQKTLFKRMLARMRRQPRGQSFVELIFVFTFLALLLAGVVEYGFMLNEYLHVLDGAREAARYSSTSLAFIMNADGSIATDGSGNIEDDLAFYYIAAAKAATTMATDNSDGSVTGVELNPAHPDDIVISVFSVTSGQTPVRFPISAPNGWSLCSHYAAFKAFFPTLTPPATVPTQLSNPAWSTCTPRQSQMTPSNIEGDLIGSAPNSGVLAVEIYYNYPQLLKLPVLTTILPDPIPLYVYTIMPLSNAEPTATP